MRNEYDLTRLAWKRLLAYWQHYGPLPKPVRSLSVGFLLVCGALLLVPAFLFPLEHYKWISVAGVILFYLGSGLILLGAIRLESTSNRLLFILGALGSASYSIYLWHMPVLVWGTALVPNVLGYESYLLRFGVYLVGSLVLGFLMSRLVEMPILRMRDRLLPS